MEKENYKSYIDALRGEALPESSGIDKTFYLRVMAKCLSEYGKVNDLEKTTVKSVYSELQAYARIAVTMAVLIHGGLDKVRDIDETLFGDEKKFVELFNAKMTEALEALPDYSGRDFLNFAVRDLSLAYLFARDFSDRAEDFAKLLGAVSVSDYSHAERVTNRNAYICAGEAVRTAFGIADSAEFMEKCAERQKSHFNGYGMYLDNFEKQIRWNPVLYDVTTRVQFKTALYFGYCRGIEDELHAGSLNSLFMQSSNGEMAYGGRSNRFVYNEALLCADFEYEASRYEKLGDAFTAGVFKRAAHLAASTVSRYLDAGKHIRNFFSDHSFGAEKYGNYDKYMVTFPAFLSAAYLFADDGIAETVCPADVGGYVFTETENFHIINALAGGYCAEVICDRDVQYDGRGLGRIHKKGIPSELGGSLSFTETPHYLPIGDVPPRDLATDFATRDENGNLVTLTDLGINDYSVRVLAETREKVAFEIKYSGDGFDITETYTVSADGVDVVMRKNGLGGNTVCVVPALVTSGDLPGGLDGKLTVSGGNITVSVPGYSFEVTSDGKASPTDIEAGNRAGIYRVVLLEKEADVLNIHYRLREEMR